MTDQPSQNRCGLDIDVVRRIEAVRRRFETEWRAGERRSIENYLDEVPGAGHPALRVRLETFEREHCQLPDDGPTAEDRAGSAPKTGATPSCAVAEAPTIAPAPPLEPPIPGGSATSVHEGDREHPRRNPLLQRVDRLVRPYRPRQTGRDRVSLPPGPEPQQHRSAAPCHGPAGGGGDLVPARPRDFRASGSREPFRRAIPG